MPEIQVTNDQLEYLEAVREDIQREIVGKYGHVRIEDAVQYLIDAHEGDGSTSIDLPGDEPAEAIEVEIEAGDGESMAAEADGTGTEDESEDGSEPSADASASGSNADEASDPDDGGSADDDGKLDAMMQLLDTHEEKWREAGGDARYEVDLPDGSTETANTKDDVRALLFRHYR